MKSLTTRRQFLQQLSFTAATAAILPRSFAEVVASTNSKPVTSFFVVGDTHYCAEDVEGYPIKPNSIDYNRRLVDAMNRLPGTALPEEAGGGTLPVPEGVIHAGDIVDNGDKGGPKGKLAEPEMAAFIADWGLNGGDALLKWPVREVHGNHDGPRGDTAVISEIKARNKRRKGLTGISESGLHYSWDWAGVHLVALGIVVGDAPEITRKRRYAPMGSLPFLKRDLEEHVGKSGRPVVLVHHIDVARYSKEVTDEVALHQEWDYGDVHAYYETLKPYRVAASICGHTHARNIFRWNGTPTPQKSSGLPFLNTDNAGHFSGPAQAILHVEIAPDEMRVREYATKDGWQTGIWTPQIWTFDLRV